MGVSLTGVWVNRGESYSWRAGWPIGVRLTGVRANRGESYSWRAGWSIGVSFTGVPANRGVSYLLESMSAANRGEFCRGVANRSESYM
jgi:hypothetical protein